MSGSNFIASGSKVIVRSIDGAAYEGRLAVSRAYDDNSGDFVIKPGLDLPIRGTTTFTLRGVSLVGGAHPIRPQDFNENEQIGSLTFPGWAVIVVKYRDGYEEFNADIADEQLPLVWSPDQSIKDKINYGSIVDAWTGQDWFSGVLMCDIEKVHESSVVVLKDVKHWNGSQEVDDLKRVVLKGSELLGLGVKRFESPQANPVFFQGLPGLVQIAAGSRVDIMVNAVLYSGVVIEDVGYPTKISRDLSKPALGPTDVVVGLRDVEIWKPQGATGKASQLFIPKSMIETIAIHYRATRKEPKDPSEQEELPSGGRKIAVLQLQSTDPDPCAETKWELFADAEVLLQVSDLGGIGGYRISQIDEPRVLPRYRCYEILQLLEYLMDIQSSTAITVDGTECIEYLFTLVQHDKESLFREQEEQLRKELEEMEERNRQLQEQMRQQQAKFQIQQAQARTNMLDKGRRGGVSRKQSRAGELV